MNNVYLIGIGGIGMSALAKFFKSKGDKVSGYDRIPGPVTKELEAMGIQVHYEEDLDQIPREADKVIYTPAIPADHKELLFYRQNGYKVMKRSEVLEEITNSSFNICVSGTHGKTTITTMIAHVLRDSDYGCNAFLGGISVNYNTNFWSSEKNVCVVEADEYDRSFLKLRPSIAIISAMDPDHLDIYGTAEAMEEAFISFTEKISEGGLLVRKHGLKRGQELKAAKLITYDREDKKANAYATNTRLENGGYDFDVVIGDKKISRLRLNMGGMHNVENAIAAIATASSLNIDDQKIRKAIENFKGVKRRFEYIIRDEQKVFIDDYAHHPEELRALISGAKSLFKGWKCTVVFQPHLYSRTRDLADGFADALSLADEIILLPIYPARELPIKGVDSKLIRKKMKKGKVMEKEELLSWAQTDFKNRTQELLITAGAGDIDALVDPIKEIIK
jgi:UDP-N-acetylmuramate--alanine ligase